MQKVLINYECDSCSKVLSSTHSNEIVSPHISINFKHNSGWVFKQIAKENQRKDYWKHEVRLPVINGDGGIKQFCCVYCLAEYFTKLLNAYEDAPEDITNEL